MNNAIKLTDIIAPAFYPVHWDILDGKHTYYDLYGGRGSTKSSFISVEIVLGMVEDPQANAVVFRKYGVTLRESVFEQIQWAIDELGMTDYWTSSVSPMQYVYKPTGQKIIFRGLDKAKKTKSIKTSRGYFKYLWFEELDEYAGAEEIRTVQQSVLRGGSKFVVFKSFNPPISRSNWANVYVNEPREDSFRHKSDYTSVPVEWLGEQFINDAEHLKATNDRAYRHEYLYLRYTAGLKGQQTEPYTPREHSGPDAACAGSGSTWKNGRTDSISFESGIQRNGNSGCTGAVRILIPGRSMDGAVCWIISGCPGRMIRRNRTVR